MNVTRPILEDINNGALIEKPFRNMQDNVFTIGIHLRHQDPASLKDPSIDLPMFTTAVNAVMHLLNDTRVVMKKDGKEKKRCVLLLASDRLHTFMRFADFAPTVGCELKYVDREIAAINNTATNKKSTEHGPWETQIMTGSDHYLLSHADYFIGSEISTFSIIIANNIVARATERGSLSSTLLWISINGKKFSNATRVHSRFKVEPDSCKNKETRFDYNSSKCVLSSQASSRCRW
jgi:hypothetical protein